MPYHCFLSSVLFLILFSDMVFSTLNLLIQIKSRHGTKITWRDIQDTSQQHLFCSSARTIPSFSDGAKNTGASQYKDYKYPCCGPVYCTNPNTHPHRHTYCTHNWVLKLFENKHKSSKGRQAWKYCISGVFLPHGASRCCLGFLIGTQTVRWKPRRDICTVWPHY